MPLAHDPLLLSCVFDADKQHYKTKIKKKNAGENKNRTNCVGFLFCSNFMRS